MIIFLNLLTVDKYITLWPYYILVLCIKQFFFIYSYKISVLCVDLIIWSSLTHFARLEVEHSTLTPIHWSFSLYVHHVCNIYVVIECTAHTTSQPFAAHINPLKHTPWRPWWWARSTNPRARLSLTTDTHTWILHHNTPKTPNA